MSKNSNPESHAGRIEHFFRLFERCQARFTLVSRHGWIEHVLPCEEAVEFLADFASKPKLAVENVTVVHRWPLFHCRTPNQFLCRSPREAPPPESQRLSVAEACEYIANQSTK